MYPFSPIQLIAQVQPPAGFVGFVDKLSRTSISSMVYLVAFCTLLRIFYFIYLNKTSKYQRGITHSFLKVVNELMDAFVYAIVVVFLLIRPYIGQTFYIPSPSMVPTLKVHDILIGTKYPYIVDNPKRGDIIMFRPPSNAHDVGTDAIDFIKRAMGVPGDIIEIKDGLFYLNGKRIQEPYLNESLMNNDFRLVNYNGDYIPLKVDGSFVNIDHRYTLKEDKYYIETLAKKYGKSVEELTEELIKLPPVAIPDNYYLAVGDNRNWSFDSRAWGLVPREDIYARGEFIIWPPKRFKSVRQEVN